MRVSNNVGGPNNEAITLLQKQEVMVSCRHIGK